MRMAPGRAAAAALAPALTTTTTTFGGDHAVQRQEDRLDRETQCVTSRFTKRYGANSGGSSFGASATAFAGPYDHAGAPAAPQPTSPSPSTWR